ncbi:MAG TPA: hypothetical protein VH682_02690 [Gemmataceae bacterium]|jgi:hypothetical protein
MDMRETSAMTEASGLIDDPAGATPPSGASQRAERARDAQPLQFNSREAAMRVAEQLREVTVKAPLRALFAAFLLGVWVARRR